MGGPKQSLKQFSEFHPFTLPYVLYRAIQQLTSEFVMTHPQKKTYRVKGEYYFQNVLPKFQTVVFKRFKSHSRAQCLRVSEETVMTTTLIIAEIRAVVNRYFAESLRFHLDSCIIMAAQLTRGRRHDL